MEKPLPSTPVEEHNPTIVGPPPSSSKSEVVTVAEGLLTPPVAQPNEQNILPATTDNAAIKSKRNSFSTSSSVETLGSASGSKHNEPVYSMIPEDYEIGAAIGFGSSGIVYYANYKPLNRTVSVKMIDLDHFERNQIDELRREIQVMTLCKHPNLLNVLASFVHESKLWIVTPYMAGGSCLDIMKTGFRDGFDETTIATILLQALQGLEYLHRNGHIHRDVKAGNLLMDKDGTVQLGDFGVSSSLMEDLERKGVRKTFVGTPCWMAPEVMEMSNKGYDSKADIWSFGITALELAYGHAPFSKYPPMKVIYLTLSSNPPSLDRKRKIGIKYSRSFKDMIDCCLQKDPIKRPTAEALLKHPFFKSVKKKSHLVNVVMSVIPPIEQRPRVTKLIKQVSANGMEKNDDFGEWDFSDTSQEYDTETIAPTDTDLSSVPNSPINSQVDTIGVDKRCSRFVVEEESNILNSLGSTPSPDAIVPPEEGTVTDTEEAAGVRKGRFSVLEKNNNNSKESNRSVSPHQPHQIQLHDVMETEEGRQSRFKVEVAIEQVNERATPQQSRFQVTQPQGPLNNNNPNQSQPVPQRGDQQPPAYQLPSHSYYEPIDPSDYEAFPIREEIGGTPPGGSFIFVHPSQLDQLLLLNELIRQQLLELRHSVGARVSKVAVLNGIYGNPSHPESSHSTNLPPASFGHMHNSSVAYEHHIQQPLQNTNHYWDGRPLVEDPSVSFAPQLSTYSPGIRQGYDQQHYEHAPLRPFDPSKLFPKRRSASIDHRHHPNQINSTPYPTQQRPTSSHHKPTNSMRSPAPLIDYEGMRRELDALRRENDQLRKRS